MSGGGWEDVGGRLCGIYRESRGLGGGADGRLLRFRWRDTESRGWAGSDGLFFMFSWRQTMLHPSRSIDSPSEENSVYKFEVCLPLPVFGCRRFLACVAFWAAWRARNAIQRGVYRTVARQNSSLIPPDIRLAGRVFIFGVAWRAIHVT